MNVWYPARVEGQPAMRVRDYLQVEPAPGADTERLPSTLLERLQHSVRAILEYEVFERHGAYLTADQKRRGRAMLEELAFARRGAEATAGSFPLVIGHPGLGGAFADNFVLWEVLASHGYVVVTSPFLPASGHTLLVDWDPERSSADISFIIQQAASWPHVDADRVAVLGHSYGAQAALAYAMQGRPVRAVVSIDSTIENASPKQPFYERERPSRFLARFDTLRAPTLIFASTGSRDHSFFDKLRRADRHLVLVPDLDHNDYIAHGGALRPRHAPETVRAEGDDGPTKALASYRLVVTYTRRFLDSHLKGLDHSEYLSSAAAAHPGASHRHLPAEPDDRDARALVRLALAGKMNDIRARCGTDASCETALWSAADALQGANRQRLAAEVFALLCERLPTNWRYWQDLADAWSRAGEVARARSALDRARAALQADEHMKDYVRTYYLKEVEQRSTWLVDGNP